LPLAASGCGWRGDGALQLGLVGDSDAFKAQGVRLSPPGRTLRAATVEGLVGFDAEGRVVPGLADRWIVTDDGQSYIFRLRDGTWPDGARIDAEDVAASLRRALAALRGSPLGLDLASIDEVRVMTDRVIEVDLQSPLPDLLTLLAQPNSAFPMRDRAAALWRCSAPQGAVLSLIPPGKRGLPAQEDFARRARSVIVEVAPAEAVARFNDGYIDVLLGGRIDSLPLAGVGGLVRGNVQMTPSAACSD
jgi:peptide/nickel transport system substrate-binding protein/oligopeptide transport system substrate-binding protein